MIWRFPTSGQLVTSWRPLRARQFRQRPPALPEVDGAVARRIFVENEPPTVAAPALLRSLADYDALVGGRLATATAIPDPLDQMLPRLKPTELRDQFDAPLKGETGKTGVLWTAARPNARQEMSLRETLAFLCSREIARKDKRRIEMSFGLRRPRLQRYGRSDVWSRPRETKVPDVDPDDHPRDEAKRNGLLRARFDARRLRQVRRACGGRGRRRRRPCRAARRRPEAARSPGRA